MRWRDISVSVRPGMVVYEGDPAVDIERVAAIAAGGICNLSRVAMGLHTGTHVDAPLHFIDGAGGVETLDVRAMMGRAWVSDATDLEGHIDAKAIELLTIPDDAERVLFRTRNSALWADERFSPDFVAITEDGARSLVKRAVRLVGIDYLSVAPHSDPAPTHVALLEAGVVILEGLDLGGVVEDWYELACLPIFVPGADGAPARALLGSAE